MDKPEEALHFQVPDVVGNVNPGDNLIWIHNMERIKHFRSNIANKEQSRIVLKTIGIEIFQLSRLIYMLFHHFFPKMLSSGRFLVNLSNEHHAACEKKIRRENRTYKNGMQENVFETSTTFLCLA